MSSIAKAALLVLLAVPCEAAISRVSCVDAAADAITGVTTQVGDFFVVSAWRDDADTLITADAEYDLTTLVNDGGNTSAIRVSYKIADASTEDTGTFTGAQAITACVYRGQNASDPIGDSSENEATTGTTETWNALTLQVTDGTSWVLAVVGNRSNTAADFGESPGTLTTVTSEQTGGASGMAWADSNAGVASYAGDTVTVTTSAANKTYTFELLAAATGDTRHGSGLSLGVDR